MKKESEIDHDISKIKEATEGTQKWGANAFSRGIIQRLATRKVFQDHTLRQSGKDWNQLPQSWNIIVFGPAGAGKSSLIYTWWRSLHSIVSETQMSAMDFAQSTLLHKLEVGWTPSDARKAKEVKTEGKETKRRKGDLRAKHGTKSLHRFQIQQPSPAASGININDTKGQGFFDEKEQRHADLLLQGKLLEGSSMEQENYRYWFTLGQIGFFVKTSLETSPHVVVLVFDASLRSVQKMADGKGSNAQLQCYRKVVSQAQQQGLEVFVALTHLDLLEKNKSQEKEGRVGETILDQVHEYRRKLSVALTHSEKKSPRQGGICCSMPEENIFVIENYRKEQFSQNSSIDLAALELLESLINAADQYIGTNCPTQNRCLIS